MPDRGSPTTTSDFQLIAPGARPLEQGGRVKAAYVIDGFFGQSHVETSAGFIVGSLHQGVRGGERGKCRIVIREAFQRRAEGEAGDEPLDHRQCRIVQIGAKLSDRIPIGTVQLHLVQLVLEPKTVRLHGQPRLANLSGFVQFAEPCQAASEHRQDIDVVRGKVEIGAADGGQFIGVHAPVQGNRQGAQHFQLPGRQFEGPP